MNSAKSKDEKWKQETKKHFQNAIYRVLHEISKIIASFAEIVKTCRINDFYTYNLGKQWEIKIKKNKIRTIYISKLLYIVLHERNNNIASVAGHLKFQGKTTFTHSL